ncbi:polysaccharide pyruvyl transferase family protein, partial [Enterococcus saccharolyticus]|uniref:polysaccharide pyruvyl transferase family protein n=1 Tax=Enterococcus saccharolyticus TaxID=41997 RepID=UPI001E596C85
AREQKSYDLMEKYFQNTEILLVPDIVLSLDVSINSEKSYNTIVTCFRDDKEKMIDSSIKTIINNFSNNNKLKVIETDTHIGKDNLTEEQLDNEFQLLLNEFSKANLVITDRLHGMILSYLVETPCLFFDNSNHKVSGVSKWIRKSSLIKKTDSTIIEQDIINMMNCQEHEKINLTNEFASLELLLNKIK